MEKRIIQQSKLEEIKDPKVHKMWGRNPEFMFYYMNRQVAKVSLVEVSLNVQVHTTFAPWAYVSNDKRQFFANLSVVEDQCHGTNLIDVSNLQALYMEYIVNNRTPADKAQERGDDFVSGQQQGVRAEEHYVLFDLGPDSLLEPVSRPEGKFRVTNYDPNLLAARHHPRKHQYLLCREPVEADVILNLPKLKTHKKAGLTAALKNLVGLNGNKEYLPHHRVGGSARGGDCYPGRSWLKEAAEYCLDEANRRIGTKEFVRWRKRVDLLLGVQRRLRDDGLEGGWYGNDTVWRMTLDLNRVLLYGYADGTLSDRPVRRIYSLTDGLIAGDREGPLAPSA